MKCLLVGMMAGCISTLLALLATAGEDAPKSSDETATTVGPRRPEHGLECRDGLDNNGNGYIDCFEPSCHRYQYCKRRMYITPEPPDKPPGYFINFGFGIALPNFRMSNATTSAPGLQANRIPFDPDIGGIFGVKTGYLFLKWLGLVANFSVTITGATNRRPFVYDRDDPSDYKYIGAKLGGHLGGAVRLQWPYCRFVPFVEVAMGYSFMQHRWHVYDGQNTWHEIDHYEAHYYEGGHFHDDTEPTVVGPVYNNGFRTRHFTLALEPGFDFFVSSRRFAIGLRAWLPIAAANGPNADISAAKAASTDNIGIMVSMTYTPDWREPSQLRPEFDVPPPPKEPSEQD
ncbi:MAG: hypothetical protein QNJ97_00435 [Myxococcota bacterium]|nr:hypothetical protein [Myxococcota bacterium]